MLVLPGIRSSSSPFYLILLIASIVTMIAAVLVLVPVDKISIPKVLLIPGYILMLNATAYLDAVDIGRVAKVLRGRKQSVNPIIIQYNRQH